MVIGPRKRMKPDQVKLAAYLGARHLHRFRSRQRVNAKAHDMRLRLVVFALALGGMVLYGLWREFWPH